MILFFDKDRKDFIDIGKYITDLAKHCNLLTTLNAREISSLYGVNDFRTAVTTRLFCNNTKVSRKVIKNLVAVELRLVRCDYFTNDRVLQLYTNPFYSAGQNSLISFFARTYFLIRHLQQSNDRIKELVTLIDEADVYFHPAWKRSFMQWLIDFFNKDFNTFRIQLIICTHSPFLLSDLTTREVILMRRTKDGTEILPKNSVRTFGGIYMNCWLIHFFLKRAQLVNSRLELLIG